MTIGRKTKSGICHELVNSIPVAEVCDATMHNSSTKARTISFL